MRVDRQCIIYDFVNETQCNNVVSTNALSQLNFIVQKYLKRKKTNKTIEQKHVHNWSTGQQQQNANGEEKEDDCVRLSDIFERFRNVFT